MDWTLIITGLISAVAGGGVGSWTTARVSMKKAEGDEFKLLIDEYKALVSENKAELERLDRDFSKLQMQLAKKDVEIIELRNQLLIFESSHTDVPLPIWLKDTKGNMLFLNHEYETQILHPINKTRDEYIGQSDYSIWPKEVADQFVRHDRKVMKQKRPEVFTETYIGAEGKTIKALIVKYPRFLNRTVIGIGGIAFDMEILKNGTK